jgi:prepilin-type N-terminal cleavage/methylation domain-containing protein
VTKGLSPTARGNRGFTLIEILVTIIISSVLAVILAQVISGQTGRSYVPLRTLDRSLALRAVMDNITSDYRYLRDDPARLDTLRSRIDARTYWADKPFAGGMTLDAAYACMDFDPVTGQEIPSGTGCPVLKVGLIERDSGQRLTAFFTR